MRRFVIIKSGFEVVRNKNEREFEGDKNKQGVVNWFAFFCKCV